MLTSAFGASIAHSMATAYGWAGTSSGKMRTGFWQLRTKSRVTVKTKSGLVSNILLTNLSVVELTYEQNGEWSPNLLAFVLSPGAKQGVDINGQGSSQYRARLTNGTVVGSQVEDICSSNEITIYFSEGAFRMSVR